MIRPPPQPAVLVAQHPPRDGGESPAAPPGPLSTFDPGFELRQDVQLGSGSLNEALPVDLDGDGLSDILEADFFDRRIRAALGNPDGSFTPFFELVTPSTPWQLDLGDYDGDGLRDVSALCTGATGGPFAVVVWSGRADGTFVETAELVLESEPYDMDTVRLPGDARDSLFVVLPLSQKIARIELAAPGLLAVVDELGVSDPFRYSAITAAVLDTDGDGSLELAAGEVDFTETGPDRVVLHDLDDPSAPPRIVHSTAAYPILYALGDADGDGFEDLGVAQLEGTHAVLLFGGIDGPGPALEVPFTAATASLLAHDFDGDGLRDLGATVYGIDAVGVRLAKAPRTYGKLDLYSVGGLPRFLCVGRFGDPDALDLFCSNLHDVSILHGDGTGSFRAARGFLVGNEPLFVRAVDLDQDGNRDVVSMDLFQSEVVFMRGAGDGTFDGAGQIPLDPTSVEWPGFVIVRDFDEDGLMDVVTAVNSADRVQLLRNPGVLPFAPPGPDDQFAVGDQPLGLDAGDLDGDGHLDVVVANSGDASIQVLLGFGDGGFDVRGAVPTPYVPQVAHLADLDMDGALDVAVATRAFGGGDEFLVPYRGDGTGELELRAAVPLPRFTPILDVGDLDEDGLPDLVGSQPDLDAAEVLLILNRADFAFEVRPLTVGFRMGTIEVADADQDGHLDVLVPLADGELVIALGDGTGAFPVLLPPPGEQFPAPRGATTSAFADVDNDGLADLLIVSPRNPYLWVALNRGVPVERETREDGGQRDR